MHRFFLLALTILAGSAFASPPPASHTLSKLESGQPVRIVCFGDSVTGVYYHTGNRRAWCDLVGLALRRLYPRANVEMINAGVGGNSTADALQRMDADVLRHHPQLVIAMFGLNDVVRVAPESFRANLRQIVQRSRGAGAEVILMTPNLVAEGDPARTLAKVTAYAQITRDVGAEMNVPVSDVFRTFETIQLADHHSWIREMSDGIHPNLRGHGVLAEEVVLTLTGQRVPLAELPRLQPGLPRVLARLQAKQPVRIIAMKPYDELIVPALRKLFPDARVDLTSWDVAGKSLAEIEAEAKSLGWPKYREHPDLAQPDLVILAVPADARATGDDQFVHDYTWIMNWSLSFTPPGGDCLVVLPSVAQPAQAPAPRSAEARALVVVQGQDLPWLQRKPNDSRPAVEVLSAKLAELLEVPPP